MVTIPIKHNTPSIHVINISLYFFLVLYLSGYKTIFKKKIVDFWLTSRFSLPWVYELVSKFPSGRSRINMLFECRAKLTLNLEELIVRRFISILSLLCPHISHSTNASLILALA